MISQKTINIIFISIIILLSVIISIISYNIYKAPDKKNEVRFLIEKDSLRTLELNNRFKKIDSIDKVLIKKDSVFNIKLNGFKKTYQKRKKDIDINRNTLPTLPNF